MKKNYKVLLVISVVAAIILLIAVIIGLTREKPEEPSSLINDPVITFPTLPPEIEEIISPDSKDDIKTNEIGQEVIEPEVFDKEYTIDGIYLELPDEYLAIKDISQIETGAELEKPVVIKDENNVFVYKWGEYIKFACTCTFENLYTTDFVYSYSAEYDSLAINENIKIYLQNSISSLPFINSPEFQFGVLRYTPRLLTESVVIGENTVDLDINVLRIGAFLYEPDTEIAIPKDNSLGYGAYDGYIDLVRLPNETGYVYGCLYLNEIQENEQKASQINDIDIDYKNIYAYKREAKIVF